MNVGKVIIRIVRKVLYGRCWLIWIERMFMEWKRVKRVNCNHNSLFVGTHHFFVLCCCITIAIVFAF